MSALGQAVVTLSAGGAWGWLAYATAAVLAACGLCVLLRGLAAAWSGRKRDEGEPGPPKGSPVTVLVPRPSWVREDGDPLSPEEERQYADIAWRLAVEAKRSRAARSRRQARKTKQRTGNQ